MVEKIQVKNFKSIQGLDIELGRFNVFIGENGSGKSNVLESIAFLSAYLNHKLDNEYLSSRGIRNTEPKFFKSLFDKENIKSPISFECTINGKKVVEVRLDFDENIEKWGNVKFKKLNVTTDDIKKILSGEKKIEPIEFENKLEELFYTILSKGQEVFTIQDENKKKTAIDKYSSVLEDINVMLEENRKEINIFLDNFLLFSPENSSLRNFADEGQILPLGIKGDGLFKEIKRLSEKKSKKQIETISKELKILDWFESFYIPSTNFPGQKDLNIKDKFISETISFLDQRVANEGFLFLLFYLTLFVSEKTPKFFAIDNIDSSFNPKLCKELIQRLIRLSKTFKKQVIVTTHNPFIIDGLNINDDEQRLFVVRRNIEGGTIINRIKPKEKLDINLSEAWLRGYIGGLPNNF